MSTPCGQRPIVITGHSRLLEFSLLRESHEVFADVAAFRFAAVGIGARGSVEMRRRFGFLVSDNYFSMLGAVPAAGRFFLPEESRPNANMPVAVVSHTLWKSLAGGRDFTPFDVSINGEPWTVVGVAPKGFSGGNAMLAPSGCPWAWPPASIRHSVRGVQTAILPIPPPSRCPSSASSTGDDNGSGRDPVTGPRRRLSTVSPDAANGPRSLEIGRRSRFNMSTEPSSDGPLRLFGALLLGMAGVVLWVACLNLANMFLDP